MKKPKLFLSNKPMPQNLLNQKVFLWIYTNNPHAPFYAFTPLAILLLISSIYIGLTTTSILFYGILGILFWSFFEYCMHRFLFHWQPKHPYLKKWLYTVHHGHHDYPNDNRIMLVHPLISLVAFFLLFGVIYALINTTSLPLMMGFAISYMFYDWLHYASHNHNFKNPFFQKMKKHHLQHHYTNNQKNFGFTSITWDVIWQTLLKIKKRNR